MTRGENSTRQRREKTRKKSGGCRGGFGGVKGRQSHRGSVRHSCRQGCPTAPADALGIAGDGDHPSHFETDVCHGLGPLHYADLWDWPDSKKYVGPTVQTCSR